MEDLKREIKISGFPTEDEILEALPTYLKIESAPPDLDFNMSDSSLTLRIKGLDKPALMSPIGLKAFLKILGLSESILKKIPYNDLIVQILHKLHEYKGNVITFVIYKDNDDYYVVGAYSEKFYMDNRAFVKSAFEFLQENSTYTGIKAVISHQQVEIIAITESLINVDQAIYNTGFVFISSETGHTKAGFISCLKESNKESYVYFKKKIENIKVSAFLNNKKPNCNINKVFKKMEDVNKELTEYLDGALNALSSTKPSIKEVEDIYKKVVKLGCYQPEEITQDLGINTYLDKNKEGQWPIKTEPAYKYIHFMHDVNMLDYLVYLTDISKNTESYEISYDSKIIAGELLNKFWDWDIVNKEVNENK
ncbi:MAG: hypothetical protein WC783_04380 [Candidatus Paceibacterota bacterium]|jgi:hypothetical protein